MPVINLQRPLLVTARQIEQRQVPPVVGVHEGVEAVPVALHALQEVDAFFDPALGQQHVGQGVLGPGLVGLQREGLAGGGFGVFEQVALFIGEGQQAVAVGDIRCGLAGLEGNAQ